MIEKTTLLNNLYDYYGVLLTDKQREYFEYYYIEDLSLSEIAENFNISRNAIHKTLKMIELLLLDYESKLKLVEKHQLRLELYSTLDNETLKNKLMDLE